MTGLKERNKTSTLQRSRRKILRKDCGTKHQQEKIIEHEELKNNNFVSPEDGFHVRIGSREYFDMLFDGSKFKELDANVESVDILNFKDTKAYTDRLKEVKARLN